ncbi:tripartite tricarboxylate transporter TctB family protein [Brevibacterium marinum]|uniref:Putative tricarboxylic transport membrane protein n=1 Tax=Brevibacterium marinum TaxID=418643 RepID=A0A846RY14_9MICO|nr:tripartite tricarboxylate transporter TctB family protein [Brevibacterium marinum]NJC56325.1 putative tricarboxylic transport membrane protein [Brevibacterium marinum]
MTQNRLSGASFPLLTLLLGVAVYLTVGLVAMEVPDSAAVPGPRFFPTIITVIAYAISAVVAVQSVRQLIADRRSMAHTEAAGSEEAVGSESVSEPSEAGVNWRMVVIVIASFLAFILLLDILGWLLSAAILVFGVATGLGAKSMFSSAFIALTMSAIVQLAFVGGLGLPLPAGFLGEF